MPTKPEKSVRYVAIGYVALAFIFFWIAGLLVDALGWRDSLRVIQQDGEVRNLVAFIVGAALLNVRVAVGAWEVFSLPRQVKYGLLLVCVAIPAYLVVSDIERLLITHFRHPTARLDTNEIASSFVFAGVYLLQALLLVRALRMARSAAKIGVGAKGGVDQ